MPYDLDQIIDRNNTGSVKWEFMRMMDPQATSDTIPFWIADMDFPCADPIIKALHQRVDRLIFGYSSHATGDYYSAVCGWYKRRFNWDIDPAGLAYSPGVVPAISFLLEILTEPGDGVIIQRPVYHPFTKMIENNRRVVVNNSLICKNGKYYMDFFDLEQKAKDPGNKLIILCSPHNPVGRVWQEQELKKLAEICLENDVLIVSDEIHNDLTRRGIKHIPLETIFPAYKNRIVTTTSPSKTFNLAGMQLSNIIIHDRDIMKKWDWYYKGKLGLMGPTPLTSAAAQAAYNEGEEWLEEVLAYLDDNFAYLQAFLLENLPKARLSPPEGTYLAWIDLGAYAKNQNELMQLLFRQAQVLVESGTIFGAEGEGFIRLNAACPKSLLQNGLRRIAGALG